jgi:AcrR family transcriptional regulator
MNLRGGDSAVCEDVNLLGKTDQMIFTETSAKRRVAQDNEPKRLRGRPRSDAKRQAVLRAANELLEERGIAALTVDAVAQRAGVAKATIYRWWRGKGPLAIEGFLTQTTPRIAYPHTRSALASIKIQIKRAASAFRSKPGKVISGLIAQGQSDPATKSALLEGFFRPRRIETRKVFQRAIDDGELRADIDIDAAIDALYGPLYYRMLVGHGPLDKAWVDCVTDTVLRGIEPDSNPNRRSRADASMETGGIGKGGKRLRVAKSKTAKG